MSGNGEPIDLNSDVDLGGQFEAHGIRPSHPVSDSLNEQSKVERRLRELEEDEAIDAQETNSFREGLCRSDKDEADTNVGYEASDDGFLEGKSPDNAKEVEMEAVAKVGEESSMKINALSEVEMEFRERIHISRKVEVVRGDEIIADNNDVVLEWATAAGTLNASSSDALVCCEAKRQVGGSLASLEEFTEDGLTDATSGHPSIISIAIERNVESQEEGVCNMQNEGEKVQQDEELAFGSVDVKRDQIVKEDCRSHRSLDHEGSIDVLRNINPEGPSYCKDADDSASLLDNLGSDSPMTAEDGRQLTDNPSQKAEKLTERDELSPVLATDIRTMPTLNCSENQSRKVGGRTIENPATGRHPETEALTDIDEANLFDVVVEVDPHVVMDEDVSDDDLGADSTDSVVELNVSDLVWGKVPSHPWWPGQICDPSASSKKAMKYFKPGRYLIAFFADHTFAWKEALMIKPFQEYFSELQKQSNLESFHQAINCALEEFSRRVEYSLACSCLSKELYSKLQTQTLTNAGIRKKSSTRLGGDISLTTSSFDPTKLIGIVKEVATLPCGEADKLELVRARAQLLAFNRWKGYHELPKFDKHIVEFNNTDHILVAENDYQSESIKDISIEIKHDEVALHGKGNSRTQGSSRAKRKHKSEDFICSSKKGKNLSGLMSKRPHRILNDTHGSEENAGNQLNLYPSCTKYEVVNDICTVNNPISHVSRESAYESWKTKQTFRVGDSIQRVAFKLNESNPIFKHDDGISPKAVTKAKGNRKHSKIPIQQLLHTEYPLNEVLSQLCLAAINPMKGFGFLSNIVNIFSEFRSFVCMGLTNLEAQETWELVSGGKTGSKLTKTEKRKNVSDPVESSDSEFIKDSYWTDRLIQGIAEDQSSFENQNETVEGHIQTPSDNVIPTAVEQDGLFCAGVNSSNQELHERVELESENCLEDLYPTALLLTFTDLDSAPSETNLNNIFRKYGALYESKTEVMKKSKRAKVVFKRNSDAEAAFSSVGKYSIFGPALLSYRLKYVPPTEVSPRPTKRQRKEAKS